MNNYNTKEVENKLKDLGSEMNKTEDNYRSKYREAIDQLSENKIKTDKIICLLNDLLNDYDSRIDNLYIERENPLAMKWLYDYKNIMTKLNIIYDYNFKILKDTDKYTEFNI